MVVGAIAYLLVTFVVTFFAAALVAGARERLLGGSRTLGLILNAIQDRAGFLGQIAVRAIGMAWQIVTWPAVPVIIVGVAWLAVVSVVTATLSGIFRTALHQSAVGAPVPPECGQDTLTAAFQTRAGRGGNPRTAG